MSPPLFQYPITDALEQSGWLWFYSSPYSLIAGQRTNSFII